MNMIPESVKVFVYEFANIKIESETLFEIHMEAEALLLNRTHFEQFKSRLTVFEYEISRQSLSDMKDAFLTNEELYYNNRYVDSETFVSMLR